VPWAFFVRRLIRCVGPNARKFSDSRGDGVGQPRFVGDLKPLGSESWPYDRQERRPIQALPDRHLCLVIVSRTINCEV
jgi:hypothetical protein